MASLTGREIEDCTPLSKSPYPLIVAFGDSITERGSNIFAADHPDGRGTGWTALLQSKLSAIADVVTRGFSGFNTASALKALPYVFPGLSKNARVVLIWFGANDAVVQGRGSQFIDVQVYGGNLKTICEAVRRMNVTPVLITPPPLQQEDADADSRRLRVNENTAKYAEKCLAVAKELDVHCIDMYTAMSKAGKTQEGLKEYLCDGLHLSGKGSEFASNLVSKELGMLFPTLKYENHKKWWGDWGIVQESDTLKLP